MRQTEALVASLMKAPKKKTDKDTNSIDYAAVMGSQLTQVLGRKVNIVDGRKKGRIELEYYGADDREELLRALMMLKK